MLLKRELTSKQLGLRKNLVGRAGEKLARDFLIEKGFKILAENLRFKNYEVDLIVFDRYLKEVVFVEVKTSSSGYFGHPSARVDRRKINALNQFAKAFLKDQGWTGDFRFDLVTVCQGKLEWFENVTW